MQEALNEEKIVNHKNFYNWRYNDNRFNYVLLHVSFRTHYA